MRKSRRENSISTEAFCAPYIEKYTKPAILLRGLRVREGYTQEDFSDIIGVSQSNLSKMELGKRPIGKIIAKRIEKAFGMHFQRFL